MNPTSQPSAPASAPAAPRRRRVWPWVLGLCLSPFVVLALAAFSYLTLDRDAAALRRHVMRATDANWSTKIQLSLGTLTLGAVRTGLSFSGHKDAWEARLALGAVKHASVGVYECAPGPRGWSQEKLFADTDGAMRELGWSRLVGVSGRKETVLIYVPDRIKENEPIEVCLAVVDGRQLVVVATSLDAGALADLVERHYAGGLKHKLHRDLRIAAR